MEKDIVWHSRLDDRYDIHVERKDKYLGDLVIKEGDNELFREEVGMQYGAIFGPDVDDVQHWQDIAIQFVDNHNGTVSTTPEPEQGN
jgi:hypothetical protein